MKYNKKIKDDVIIIRLFKEEKNKFIENAIKSGSPSLTSWILEILRKNA